MNRWMLAGAIVLSLGNAGNALAAIPGFNATCPGAIEVHADEGGPVYVNGRETQLKRFNDNYFEARDAQSEVTLSLGTSPDGSVQLSYTGKGGANGVCTVGKAAPASGAAMARETRVETRSDGATEVTCESVDQRQAECAMDTHGDVRLIRQLSKAHCEQGQSWGLYHHSVWVKDGCRAVFKNVSASRYTMPPASRPGMDTTLLGACNARAQAEGALVTRLPVNDTVTELIVDYPEGRFLCMVRNDGLVQSLTQIRKR
nr:DUF3011 domain-containing protein [Pseudoxanthomonas sp.]